LARYSKGQSPYEATAGDKGGRAIRGISGLISALGSLARVESVAVGQATDAAFIVGVCPALVARTAALPDE